MNSKQLKSNQAQETSVRSFCALAQSVSHPQFGILGHLVDCPHGFARHIDVALGLVRSHVVQERFQSRRIRLEEMHLNKPQWWTVVEQMMLASDLVASEGETAATLTFALCTNCSMS